MSKRLEEITRRRMALQVRCEAQRAELAAVSAAIERQLAPIDQGIALVRRLLASPLTIIAAVAAIALIGPRRLIKWAGRAALLMTTYRQLMR
jgi:hypothetical protein